MSDKNIGVMDWVLHTVRQGKLLTDQEALLLAEEIEADQMMQVAATIRDSGFRNVVTYSILNS